MNEPERFDRQRRFAGIGAEGQRRIESARVLLAGCGALGGSLAQSLVRCGVGTVVLVDRDVVETSNLPRQVLFSERHARDGTPKALAAADTLAAIGGPTRVEAHVAHIDADNLPDFARGAELLLDGTDNLATRYLLNDWSVREGVPWIYAGVVGAGGLVLPVLPGRGACLRCLFPEPPPPESLPTCDTAGVVLPAVAAIAAFESALALRWIAGGEAERAAFVPRLTELDLWSGDVRTLGATRDPGCPCCGARNFEFLEASTERAAVVLCGRNTVQVRPPRAMRPDFAALSARLAGAAESVERLPALLRFRADGFRVSLFPDGRALIEGTDDPGRARGVYDRWIGS